MEMHRYINHLLCSGGNTISIDTVSQKSIWEKNGRLRDKHSCCDPVISVVVYAFVQNLKWARPMELRLTKIDW